MYNINHASGPHLKKILLYILLKYDLLLHLQNNVYLRRSLYYFDRYIPQRLFKDCVKILVSDQNLLLYSCGFSVLTDDDILREC